MEIIKAKWPNDADSPVVLMIDDLDNLWFDLNGNGHYALGEDWGYWRDLPGSSFAFLKNNLIDKFPKIKITFFTVIGDPTICKHKYGKVYKGAINEDEKTAEFFRHIHFSPNFEIAYHGLTHGIIRNGKYIHEWDSFNSIEQALRNIEEGQGICQRVFGEKLKGGKYPGYTSNTYSDESIDRAGFSWWCRHWTYDDFLKAGSNYSVFEMKTFGRNKVVDFPSTVNPSTFRNPIKKIARMILRRPHKSLKMHLEGLLSNKKVISIQEHAGAIKANGVRQTPNIIDDMPVLHRIFSYLRGKNVWHATCSEIANYFHTFTSTQIETVDKKSFRLKYTGRVEKPGLTLMVDREEPVEVISPSGRRYKSIKYLYKNKWQLVHIKVENGYYQIKKC